ncbi:MAG: acyltransferase domain-containing protein [Cellvibrionaceae bacterium]|nr:acyltransferase domain-containing protein [Cellvibrionaceae bacterium]
MSMPIVFMFSGQGSQYFQMGRELFENNPRFRLWMNFCSKIVEDLIGESLVDIIYYRNEKSEKFDRILHSNPALLSIEYSLSRMLIEKRILPDCLLGYSLGEMTAAVVSDALTIEEGLVFAVDVARTLEESCPIGAMLAIVDSENIINSYSEAFANCTVSGRNFENNFVVSGLLDDVLRLQHFLESRNVLTHRLSVKYGFHSEVLENVSEELKRLCCSLNFRRPRYPVYSSVESSKIEEYSEEYFWRVIREPVNLMNAVNKIEKSGSHIYIDVGPSGTLSTSVSYLLNKNSSSKKIEVINQFGKDIEWVSKLESQLTTWLVS